MAESASPTFPASGQRRPTPMSGKADHVRCRRSRSTAAATLAPFTVAYMTYGTLNAARINAVLVCHALTGDQFVASRPSGHRQARLVDHHGRPGQADRHRPLLRHLRQCAGRLHGHDRPGGDRSGHRQALWPELSRWSPSATWCARRRCCSMRSASSKLLCVIGGSMGGMQVLQWAASYPERVRRRDADRHRRAPFGAEHRVPRSRPPGDHGRSRLAGRRLSAAGTQPSKGLAVARMAAHITYLSEAALQRKFGRALQNRERRSLRVRAGFPGRILSAPSGHRPSSTASTPIPISTSPARWIISISRRDYGGVLAEAFRGTQTRFCIVSFTSDWLFPTAENKRIAHALNAAAAQGQLCRDRDRQRPRRLPAR